MPARIAQDLRALIKTGTRTNFSAAEIDSIARQVNGSVICTQTLRRAIQKAAPAARVSDEFLETTAASLQASAMMR